MWDVGDRPANSLSTRGVVLQLEDGDESRDGDGLSAVTPGTVIWVRGVFGIPLWDGATALDVGIESQSLDGASTTITTVSIALPAPGSFAADGPHSLTVPADRYFATPYMKATGGAVWIEEVQITASGPTPSSDVPDFTPAVLAVNSASVVAGEDLVAGEFVNIYADSGVAKARKADATDDSKPADGFVLAAVASGATAKVLGPGSLNDQLAGMTPGALQYLATGGGRTETAPSAGGNWVQPLGKAVSATELQFAPQPGYGISS